jgi:hypothetical protein
MVWVGDYGDKTITDNTSHLMFTPESINSISLNPLNAIAHIVNAKKV